MTGYDLGRASKQKEQLGYVALILHAHLPYIRHQEQDDLMEERWFFEAMTETYLPLLDSFARLTEEQIPYRISISMSPTLLALMEDPLMQERYEQHLVKSLLLAEKELKRTKDDPKLHATALMYHRRWSAWLELYDKWDRNIIPAFKQLQQEGSIEIMTCSASHAFLPFVKHPALAHAQIEVGCLEYERHFGIRPRGMWLPECAYSDELSAMLTESGIQYIIIDHHALLLASAKAASTYTPIQANGASVKAFARDPYSSEQVWSSHEGYPGDPDYREYYRDIGYDLGWHDQEEWAYIKPFVLSDGTRMNTGLKYYRVTGTGIDKEPYVEEWANNRAVMHARHFLESREKQLQSIQADASAPPIIVCPYDAELFGHWWYEGPYWIESLFREMHLKQQHADLKFSFISPIDYIHAHPTVESADIPTSSWGRGGYGEVWLQERNDWIYRHLHQTEDRLINIFTMAYDGPEWGFHPVKDRIGNQAIRELFLAQSSDWAFIIDADTVPSYAMERTKQHILRCHTLLDMLESGVYDEVVLFTMEREIPCFSSIQAQLRKDLLIWQHHGDQLYYPDGFFIGDAQDPYRFLIQQQQRKPPYLQHEAKSPTKHVLMLAWEYPPLVVGGLSRAVYDLSRHLVHQQCQVHVLTRSVPGSPAYESMDGVHVYRIPLPSSVSTIHFMDWVLQMNIALAEACDAFIQAGYAFDFLHAHDWLVYGAAKSIKDLYHIPLISTIHATEHGRNHGVIASELQQRIHNMEYALANESREVIVCSEAMVKEIERLFHVPKAHIHLIPNGVECRLKEGDLVLPWYQRPMTEELRHVRAQYAAPEEPILFFIGRLVYEKGIQVLLHALTHVQRTVPNVKLIIAGTGPMMSELRSLIASLQLEHAVHLTGFVMDEVREHLFQIADVCVFPSLYEPFGIVALEAMGAGIPVVVSDTGGLAEIVDHGIDGYKALPGHVESLAWHMTELLQNKELGVQFAERALHKVKTQYDWNTIALSTRHVYERVIAQ
ncbi:1,4-alpha-glucan branching protein domain-containing protein [Paenibacillus sp. 1001270B_150601_E10]|uniref:1,4-alpha-glucan branching protein domain-containing protein n=1 Tax=Paenibacillus sp. 1001270B_150601_E10 TaxID=2787079 RepID=UPI00189DE95C|nr:1,4-alpha-glucan branching protein domain-containing protein [Paenibacillus sp. 1001270B_150601_E10]